MAAARPFGPEPTTTASTGPSAKIEDSALRGGFDRDGAVALGRDDRIDLVIGSRRVVVKQQEPLDAGRLGEADRVLDGRMPEGSARRELGLRQLRVMDQQVGVSRQRNRGRMVGAESVGSGTKGDRTVVGQVRDRGAVAGDAVAVGKAALVWDFLRDDVKAFDRPGSLLNAEEPPTAA